jgi:serine phosphatase RsbU (regulator of sigma subunit)
MPLLFLLLFGNLWALSELEGKHPEVFSRRSSGYDFTPPPVSSYDGYTGGVVPRSGGAGAFTYPGYPEAREPLWKAGNGRFPVFDMVMLLISGILLFSAAGLAASILGLSSAAADCAALRVEAAALISGDFMPQEKKKQIAALKRRGVGLRIKLASFTICLVLLVVVMVSAPLYFRMTQTQQETLLGGLHDRVSVLLEGLASGARAYLPAGNDLELSFLPSEIIAIPEARYVTITSYDPASGVFDDQVWATNDPDILDKIDTPELRIGVSRLTDRLSPRLANISAELNARARSRVGRLATNIAALTREAPSRTDEAVVRAAIASLETRLNEELIQLGREIGSEPAYRTGIPVAEMSQNYIFFKPILYHQGTDAYYFRGLIRLEVSVESILRQIAQGKEVLQQLILFVALTALAIGTLGALILSGFIIRPIHRLVSHVELIRDTDDKSRLEGVNIRIKSNDELAVLGATINDMTGGLVRAAQASHDLVIGKEIQKKFIPLETDRYGNKMTTGYTETKHAQFFGYYEGAKGVSGDYFDYQNLDDRYFALIKCDVAGKGVPAALIMIQVATMFLNYFKTWKPDAKGMRIEEVVYQINDFIEALGFKGRFAAFTLALFDSFTGLIRFCNAGDNIIHWFDASERKMKAVTLRETPAVGVVPNALVETKGGYTVQPFTLESGDILFLYTDGIEEAKRKFRDASFKEIPCTEENAGALHENHAAGQWNEEMGAARVEAVINAVMNRQIYTLKKRHDPEGDRLLQFDFTRCEGTVEEAIMALVSVEKIFRMYKSPSGGGETRILVDRKVDEFLKNHFLQYQNYCYNTREYPENNMYMYYTHVNEDAQYDDLTILGIKQK